MDACGAGGESVMRSSDNSVAELFDRLKRKNPAYLDLATAETEEEFEAAFCVILEHAVHHLEKNKKNFEKLDEEGLSGAFAGTLSIPGALVVTQETNSNGHVDLTIEAECTPVRIKLGEAKIYSSPSYHIKGIRQLVERYTTGRETEGLLINYVRMKDIKGITEKLRTEMDKQLPVNQTEPCKNHKLKWSLVTKHKHSSGEVLSVAHVGCNLCP
jgi:hypothetical protein